MNISNKSVQGFKRIMKEKYSQDLTDAEARKQSERLVNFFEVLHKQTL